MKAILISAFFCASAVLAEEYILDKEEQMAPAGTVFTWQLEYDSPNTKLTFLEDDSSFSYFMDANEENTIRYEVVDKNSFKELMTYSSTSKVFKLPGQKEIEEQKESCMNQIELIFEKKEGKWSARTKKKIELTDEQKNYIERRELETQVFDDFSLFGYEPRKVGETWAVEPEHFNIFFSGYAKEMSGEVLMSFLSVEELNGRKCAKCKVVADVKGKNKDNEAELTFKGEITVYRDLQYTTDLKRIAEISFSYNGPTADKKSTLRRNSEAFFVQEVEVEEKKDKAND